MFSTRHLLALTLALSTTPCAVADSYTYLGQNSLWKDASAWNAYLGYPNSITDSALITPTVPANATNTLTLNTYPSIAAVTLGSTGPGTMQLVLNGSGISAANLTITSGGLISGAGKIGSANPTTLINSGTINASGTGIDIELAANATSSNNGTLEATNGGNLSLSYRSTNNTALNNTGGTIQALASANGTPSLVTAYVTITGGTLFTDSLSSIQLLANGTNFTSNGNFAPFSCTLANVTFNGTVKQWGQTVLTIAGNITNNANWTQTGYNRISVVGNQTLAGTGSITFSNNSNLTSSTPSSSLTIASQQTIQGTGTLGTNANLSLINNGTILANTLNQSFTINSPLTNNALLSAAANSSISITAPLTTTANSTLNADGNITLSSTLTGPLHKTGNATLTLNQTYTTPSPISLTAGTLQLTAPSNAAPAITGNGTLALTGALTLTPSTTASTLATLSFANTTIPAGNYINLTSNTLILNPANKASTLSTLQSALTAGTSHTAGIFSSTLPATQALALLDNGQLPTPYTTFANQPVTTNSLLLTPELLGDATLDGSVDLNDLNLILNHLGQSTPLWSNGNFDAAPTIDLNDLNAVLNHLGSHTASPFLAAAAPEPASFALLLVPLLLLVPRRRTR